MGHLVVAFGTGYFLSPGDGYFLACLSAREDGVVLKDRPRPKVCVLLDKTFPVDIICIVNAVLGWLFIRSIHEEPNVPFVASSTSNCRWKSQYAVPAK